MKTPRIANAIGHIDDDLVSGANRAKVVKKNAWFKWGSIAACFVVMLAAMLIVMPMLFEEDSPFFPPDSGSVGNEGDSAIVPPNNGAGGDSEGEFQLESYYDFEINSDTFTAYIGGKVIGAEKVGAKFKSVTVTGGWKNEAGEWISTETLNAELYEITGIDRGIAVALKFIDQSEGATTTHYYVMMNPNADLSDVEEYVRDPIVSNNPGDEMVNE